MLWRPNLLSELYLPGASEVKSPRFALRDILVVRPLGDPRVMLVMLGELWAEVPRNVMVEALLEGDLQEKWNTRSGHHRDDTPTLAMMRGA
ncbi:hypothetical protein RHGRI_014234 [Rhododendron griersonianum]|uniref:Uncharacterized protein n=1 Tax=Rhododendron griersonianum TaxID=479676 RepID=A0AAV6K8M5_9ERIC|nr:hypothetical protein RHGRI_014234 [Rhododendron griersonianum]